MSKADVTNSMHAFSALLVAVMVFHWGRDPGIGKSQVVPFCAGGDGSVVCAGRGSSALMLDPLAGGDGSAVCAGRGSSASMLDPLAGVGVEAFVVLLVCMPGCWPAPPFMSSTSREGKR